MCFGRLWKNLTIYEPCKIKVIFIYFQNWGRKNIFNCRFFVYLYESIFKLEGTAEKINILPVQNQLSFKRAEVESLRWQF